MFMTMFLSLQFAIGCNAFRLQVKPTSLAHCLTCSIEIDGWHADFFSNFIDNIWQKRPLLIRNACPNVSGMINLERNDFELHVSGDEDVESRLIYQRKGKWKKVYGPFSPDQIDSLDSRRPWSILIQDCDRHLPKVADLWSLLPFIPTWLRDDIMISYSTPHGGIGAHVDNYDVFLLQGK
jgi:50S ribosomal protein L16 3-hydroxylase